MKNLSVIILALSFSLFILNSSAAVSLKWTVETSRLQPAVFDVVRGETLDLEASFKSYGTPVATSNMTAFLCWQTNGMESAWWVTNAVTTASVARVLFTPEMDPGAPTVNAFIGLSDSTNQQTNYQLPANKLPSISYRAAFTLRFRHGPGAAPNVISAPVPILDLEHTVVVNPPWPTKADFAATTTVMRAELKDYVDEQIEGSGLVTPQTVTNISASVTSNVVTKAYVEGLGISSGGGVDTNSVQGIIRRNIETNLICTVSDAQKMTNYLWSAKRGLYDFDVKAMSEVTSYSMTDDFAGCVFVKATHPYLYHDMEIDFHRWMTTVTYVDQYGVTNTMSIASEDETSNPTLLTFDSMKYPGIPGLTVTMSITAIRNTKIATTNDVNAQIASSVVTNGGAVAAARTYSDATFMTLTDSVSLLSQKKDLFQVGVGLSEECVQSNHYRFIISENALISAKYCYTTVEPVQGTPVYADLACTIPLRETGDGYISPYHFAQSPNEIIGGLANIIIVSDKTAIRRQISAEVDADYVNNHIASSTNGLASASTVSSITSQLSQQSQQLAAIGANLNAEDAHFVSTNYDSAVHMPEAYVEIRMSNVWITIWREMTRWTKFAGSAFDWNSWCGFHDWMTNVTQQLSFKADRSWGAYDSETGGYSPDGFTQISSSNILIAANMSYQRTVTTGGAVWVLQCNSGTANVGGDTNGFFRIKDGDGVTQFEIIKGNKQELGADADGITVDNSTSPPAVTIPYSVEADEHPVIQICDDLNDAQWKAETDASCIANVSWSGSSGAYVATVQRKTAGESLFVKATYMSGGETYIHNIAPVGMDSIMLNGTKYYLGTAVISGNTVLTLSTTPQTP